MAFGFFLYYTIAIALVQWMYGIAFLGKDVGFLLRALEKINDRRFGNTIQERYRKNYYKSIVFYLIFGVTCFIAPSFLVLDRYSFVFAIIGFIFIIMIIAQVLLMFFQKVGLGLTYYSLALIYQYILQKYSSVIVEYSETVEYNELTVWRTCILIAMVIGTLILVNETLQFDNINTENKMPATNLTFKISIRQVMAGLLALMGAVVTIRDFGAIVLSLFK